MKKIVLTFVISVTLFAQSFLISNIPVPKNYIQNLDPYPCDETCLQTYIDNDMIFSFLSHATQKLDNKKQDDIRTMNISILNLGAALNNKKVRIALMLPYKKIGKYASSTTNAAFAYLMTRNQSFELKSYKIKDESKEEISRSLQLIKDDGFTHIVAPLTLTGAKVLTEIDPDINIFLPTINKMDVENSSSNLFFGGINYKEQSDLLLKQAVSPLVIFYDKSSIGKKLAMNEENSFKYDENQTLIKNRKVIKFSIPRNTTNLQKQLKENEDIQLASFFINTPIVKTSMIMSQLTLYDANATNVLSTQVNYDPLILSMTQYNDRKDMFIANSITQHNNVIIETNSLLNNDIEYDWINYTTTIGVDYFFNLITNADREYNIFLKDNQMIYSTEILKPSYSRFIKVSTIKE
jgi:SRSO17 transposase